MSEPPATTKPANDSEAFEREMAQDEFFHSVHAWVCRVLNVTKSPETTDASIAIIALWQKISDKPTWYTWPYHALAALTDMNDPDGFRYQRRQEWEPIDPDLPIHTYIAHNAFVHQHFPHDLQNKFVVYGLSDNKGGSPAHQQYFQYRKQTLDKCCKHLRQSLIGS